MNIRAIAAIGLALSVMLSGCRVTFVEKSDEDEERLRRLEERVGATRGEDGRPGHPGRDGKPGQPGRGGIQVRGSGNVIMQDRRVAGFSEVSLRGSATLLIDQSGSESLVIEAEDNLMDHLISEVVGSRLELGLKPGTSIEATRPIIYRLSVAKLQVITASGSGEIEAKRLSTEILNVRQSGSFDITMAGSASRQEVRVSGSGSYLAEGLESKEAIVDISGSGEALVKVTERLDVSIKGSGLVQYVGDPKITRDIKGSGALEKKL